MPWKDVSPWKSGYDSQSCRRKAARSSATCAPASASAARPATSGCSGIVSWSIVGAAWCEDTITPLAQSFLQVLRARYGKTTDTKKQTNAPGEVLIATRPQRALCSRHAPGRFARPRHSTFDTRLHDGMSPALGPISEWPRLCEIWMRANGWLPAKPPTAENSP